MPPSMWKQYNLTKILKSSYKDPENEIIKGFLDCKLKL